MTDAHETHYDKLWASHLVRAYGGGMAFFHVDRQPIGEVSSPQARDGVRTALRGVRRPAAELAVADHAAGRP